MMNGSLSDHEMYPSDGIRITHVPFDEFENARSVFESAFPDISPRFFFSIVRNDPWYNPKFCLAIQKGKRYLSYIQIFDRSIYFQNQTIRVGGIGNVGTRPECRGRGYAGRLIEHALRIMGQEEMAVSFLYTTIQSYYERFGWKILPLEEQEIDISQLKHLRKHAGSFRRLQEKDYPLLHEMYSQRQSILSGTLLRDFQYWESRPTWMSHVPVVLLEGEKPAAYFYYAKYTENRPVLTISEYGFSRPDPDLLTRLFAVMSIKAEEKACKGIKSFFAPDPDIYAFLQTEKWKIREIPYPFMMCRNVAGKGFHDIIQKEAENNGFVYWQTDAF